ncbi:MAG TPA: hypothetical protein VHO25_01085 [Polyangiaceae bacterium]|nr:hypothetical protein [Polyangiaceae bacterium]
MSWLRKMDAWFMKPCPTERLALLRMAIGAFGVAYILLRLPHWFTPLGFERAGFAPIGVFAVLPIRLPMAALVGLVVVSVIAGALFTIGYRLRASGPVYACGLLLLTTYRNCWGMIFHVENLLVLHTLTLGLAPLAEVREGVRRAAERVRVASGWCVRLLCLLTVVTYVIAGVAKLQESGLGWAVGDVLREHIAYDAVRKLELGAMPSPIAAIAVRFAPLFPPLAVLTLLIELGAPVALLGPRCALVWCLGALSFHVGVLALMGIVFPYPLLFVAYLPFFPVEQWLQRWPRLAQRLGLAQPRKEV